MHPKDAVRFVRAIALLVALVTAFHTTPAHADNVDSLIDQLNNGDSDRARNSAALNLVKLNDPSTKVLLALAKAVINDSDRDVRATAAAGLGKLGVNAKGSVKSLIVKNLQQAASQDSSDFVKGQAQKALGAITGQSGGSTGGTGTTSQGGGGGGIYVNVGPMSSKTGGANDAKLKALMAKVAAQTLTSKAPHMTQTWSGGTPSKAGLAASKTSGFYVDGTLNELKVKTSGSGATISCKVSMLLADFPDKNMFGFLNGGASVTAGSSEKDQAMAGEDCVQAVIENLISSKIVPTICTKVSGGSCP
jgi:hypothetical protein